MQRRISAALVAMVALALGACANDTPREPLAQGTTTPVPSVSIGACQTSQGAQGAAPPKGVDFKTQLREQGVLNVGSDNAYPPFEEIKPGKDEPEGFDVDLYTEVAKRLGLTAKSTTTNFDALFTQSIPSGRFDIGVSAITIKEDRKKSVDFTVPYFQADLSLAVNTARTPEITSVDDLSGQTIGAQSGTTGEDCAKVLVGDGKAKDVKSYDDAKLAFQDLAAGRVAAVVNDRPASEGIIASTPDIKVVQVITTQEQYGFAISKDKPDLRVAIDEQLLAMMQDGTYATIYEKWFKTPPPFDVPLTVAASSPSPTVDTSSPSPTATGSP